MPYRADRSFTFYFVRHGITAPNFAGLRCGGDVDLPMMDIGCDQAYLLAKQIERMHLGIGLVVCGSLLRTRQTAAIVSGVLGMVPVEVEPLLNERRPLLVSSKGVGRMLYRILGGEERMQVGNGEIMEFAVTPGVKRNGLRVSKLQPT